MIVMGAAGAGLWFGLVLIVPVTPGGTVCPSPVRKKTTVLLFAAGLLGPFTLKSPLNPAAPCPEEFCVKIPGAVDETDSVVKFELAPRYFTPTVALDWPATSYGTTAETCMADT